MSTLQTYTTPLPPFPPVQPPMRPKAEPNKIMTPAFTREELRELVLELMG